MDLRINRKVPFLAMKPRARRCLMAFLPAACFLREMMRPLCFMRSDFFKPPDVCLAVPCHTIAFVPTAGILSLISILFPQKLFHERRSFINGLIVLPYSSRFITVHRNYGSTYDSAIVINSSILLLHS